uniref:Uncharacterized protein n=1 Tax=Ralstonia syzygii R24 TaxID=907261 RepID=G3ABD7_9RALS|nr:hypothetical protein RALSY_mp30138 [Ralstonia syzygii R24]
MPTEPFATFDVTRRNACLDTVLPQRGAAAGMAVAFVGMDFLWAPPWSAALAWHWRNGLGKRFEHHRVMAMGTRHDTGQRHALGIYRYVPLPLPRPSSWRQASRGMPVSSTNGMPLSAARPFTRGPPPLADGCQIGSTGSRVSHNPLLIGCLAMQRSTSHLLFSMTGWVSGCGGTW